MISTGDTHSQQERYRYTIIKTHRYFTIKELGIQVHKSGTIRKGITPGFSPYRQAVIFETNETDPVKIVAAYRSIVSYRAGKTRKCSDENHTHTHRHSKAALLRWRILHDEAFLRGLALAIRKELPGSHFHAATNNEATYYVHWRQYHIRVSNREPTRVTLKNYQRWRYDPKYGPEKHIGIVLKISKHGRARFLIGGGQLLIPDSKIDRDDLYGKVIEYLKHRGFYDE